MQDPIASADVVDIVSEMVGRNIEIKAVQVGLVLVVLPHLTNPAAASNTALSKDQTARQNEGSFGSLAEMVNSRSQLVTFVPPFPANFRSG